MHLYPFTPKGYGVRASPITFGEGYAPKVQGVKLPSLRSSNPRIEDAPPE